MKNNSASGQLTVLLVGSGGREHAIAWKLAQSPRLGRLLVAPGNPGMAELGENFPVSVTDISGLTRLAQAQGVDLAVIGPEVPLSLGLADALEAVGVDVFGPQQAAAQLESSKVFAKACMARFGIPTARYESFTEFAAAAEFARTAPYPLVIKASGLAAGKGVFLPATPEEALEALRGLMLDGQLGEAGQTVVIEERLEGEEVSLLGFTDGVTVRAMPPAQDHKRLQNGDEGPNTGGMGAYAPAPVVSAAQTTALVAQFLQPVVDGLREQGVVYRGVLYAGLMLTEAGPKALEYNCRFGDPETQAILPLLKSDLLEIALACARGGLADAAVEWEPGASACVVLASAGYPAAARSGDRIDGLDRLPAGCQAFHAGTREENGRIFTAGGRVLGLTGTGANLTDALAAAYRGVAAVRFAGMQFRRDIGARGLRQQKKTESAYARAGVDIDAGNQAVARMAGAVRSTYTPAVLAGIGSFGGLFDGRVVKDMDQPVLVASTDGVGTKIMLAAKVGRYAGLGEDIVNHCIDDILVQGARPIFFLDYFATSKLDPVVVAEIVSGMAAACRASGCVLIGGETAEMPGVYREGEFDIAGTIVGLVERSKLLPRPGVRAGDVLVGLRSSGPHTNGYSLMRQIFAETPLEEPLPGMNVPLADLLLAPHRSYLPVLGPALDLPDSPVKALAHLTGGGVVENLPRVLPEGVGARVRLNAWPRPELYRFAQELGGVSDEEMARVFNLGIGMVAVVAAERVTEFQGLLGEESWVIGELTAGERKVSLQ